MPYRQEWVSRDIALQHKGVVVYHAYRDNDYEEEMENWFSLVEDGNDFDDFDHRDISLNGPILDSSTHGIIKQAIDEGILKNGMDRDDIEKAIATH